MTGVTDVEVKRYESVTSGSQTCVIEQPGGRLMCMCPAPESAAKAAIIVRALNYDSRVHGDRSHAPQVPQGMHAIVSVDTGQVVDVVPALTERVAGRISGSEH